MLKRLFDKYRSVIAYVFFGGITTVVNLVAYYLCCQLFSIPNTPSVIISWILAVLVAFLTNKPFVFDSHDWSLSVLLPELSGFFGCRAGTGVMELIFMHITVDILDYNGMLMKLLINILVIILNYVGSKLLVFRK